MAALLLESGIRDFGRTDDRMGHPRCQTSVPAANPEGTGVSGAAGYGNVLDTERAEPLV